MHVFAAVLVPVVVLPVLLIGEGEGLRCGGGSGGCRGGDTGIDRPDRLHGVSSTAVVTI